MGANLLVAINGFGRVGRCVTREMHKREQVYRLVAVADLDDAKTLAHLLKHDSIHGGFVGKIEPKDGKILIDGLEVDVTPGQRSPRDLPWRNFKSDSDRLVVVESTGVFTNSDSARLHLEAGADFVIITGPSTRPDMTVVFGVNGQMFSPEEHRVISLGSCTTNCLVPVVKVLHEAFGIEQGFMTTVHAYTNDQPSQDEPHRDLRRARAAALNIVPTTTGAARLIGQLIPGLEGRMDGFALRVPVPDGSVTDLTVNLAKKATATEINRVLREASERIPMIIGYTEEPIVSSDVIGDRRSVVVDGLLTATIGKTAKVVLWYDNEIGFANRVVDAIERIASIERH